MSEETSRGTQDELLAWSAPAIRSVIPLSHTRGGVHDINDQDDGFYRIS